MTRLALQISPEAKGAYFDAYLDVARAELDAVIGCDAELVQHGALDFLVIDGEGLDRADVLELSFVQGLYEVQGDLLRPTTDQAEYALHADFVFGSKFKGKTNERLTQLLINLGLAHLGAVERSELRVLDPMCGRATTLLWAMRYGMSGWGVEQDPHALLDIERNVKKWSKLHRQKHKLEDGFLGKKNKKGIGRFLDFRAAGAGMKVAIGDASEVGALFGKRTYDLIISDLPYGVQHMTKGGTRNPLAVLETCTPVWSRHLSERGALVLAFNANNPKRGALIDVFEAHGLKAKDFRAPHRMSESILRDVVVFSHS